jgi:hypothetical protein
MKDCQSLCNFAVSAVIFGPNVPAGTFGLIKAKQLLTLLWEFAFLQKAELQ